MGCKAPTSEGQFSGAVHLERGGLYVLLGAVVCVGRAVAGRTTRGAEAQRTTGRGEAAGAGLGWPVQVAAGGHQVAVSRCVRECVSGASGAGAAYTCALSWGGRSYFGLEDFESYLRIKQNVSKPSVFVMYMEKWIYKLAN